MTRWLTRLGLIPALALLASAVPSQAQLAPGYSGQSSSPTQGTNEHFWYALRDLGECFAKTKAKESRALLETEARSVAEAKAASAMLGRQTMCLRSASRMQVQTALMRGAIAEGMYRKYVSSPLPAVDMAPVAALSREEGASINPYGLLAKFADCLAATHPQEIHQILTTTKLGQEEGWVAIEGLSPKFEACLPSNVRIEFEPSDVRMALAEAMYKRALTTQSAQQRGK